VSSCCREPNLLLHHKRVEGDGTGGRFLSPAFDLFHRIELRNRGGYCSRRSLAHGSAAFGQWTKGLASQWLGGRLAAVSRVCTQCECALPCMRSRASRSSTFRGKRRKGCYLSSICSKRFSGRLEPAESAESEASPFRVVVGSLGPPSLRYGASLFGFHSPITSHQSPITRMFPEAGASGYRLEHQATRPANIRATASKGASRYQVSKRFKNSAANSPRGTGDLVNWFSAAVG
jgi:hypothetical protein